MEDLILGVNQPGSSEYLKGEGLFKQGNYKQALLHFTEVLNYNYKLADTYTYIGACYGFLNNNTEAINCFKKALEIDDKNGMAYYNLGLIESSKNNYDYAIDLFTKAIEYNAVRLWDCYYCRAQSLFFKVLNDPILSRHAFIFYEFSIPMTHFFPKAKDDIIKSIHLNPHPDVDAYFLAGQICKKMRNFKEAIFYFKKAVELGDKEAAQLLREIDK